MGLLSKVKKQAKAVSQVTPPTQVQKEISQLSRQNKSIYTPISKQEETVRVKIKNLFNTSTTERRLTKRAFVNYVVSTIISSHPIFTGLFNQIEFYDGDSCYVTPSKFMFGDKFFRRPVDDAIFICYRECFNVFLGNKVELDIDFQERDTSSSNVMNRELIDFYSRLHKNLFYTIKQDFDIAILSYTMLRTPADLGLKFQQLQLSTKMYEALNTKYSLKKDTKYLSSTAWEHKSSQFYLMKLRAVEQKTFNEFKKIFKLYLRDNTPIEADYKVAVYPLEHVSHNSRLNDPIQIVVPADKLTFLCNKVKMEILEDCYTSTLTSDFKLELERELKSSQQQLDTSDDDLSSSVSNAIDNTSNDLSQITEQSQFSQSLSNDVDNNNATPSAISFGSDTQSNEFNNNQSELQQIRDNIRDLIISEREEKVSSSVPDPTRGLSNEKLTSDVDTLLSNMGQGQLQEFFDVDSPMKAFSEDEQRSVFDSNRSMMDNLNILNGMKQQLSSNTIQDILSSVESSLNYFKELQEKLLGGDFGFSDQVAKQIQQHIDISNVEHLDELKDNLDQNKQEYLNNILNDESFIESTMLQTIAQYRQKHPESNSNNELASELNKLQSNTSFEQELLEQYAKSFTDTTIPMSDRNGTSSYNNETTQDNSLDLEDNITSLEILSQLDDDQLDTLYDNVEDITDTEQLMNYIKNSNLTEQNQILQGLVNQFDDLALNGNHESNPDFNSEYDSAKNDSLTYSNHASTNDTLEINDDNASPVDLQSVIDKLKLKYHDSNVLDDYIEMYNQNRDLQQQLSQSMDSFVGNYNLDNNSRVDDNLFTKEEHGNFMQSAESFLERGFSLDGCIILNQALTLNTEMQAPPVWWKQAQKMLKAMTKKSQPSYLRPKKKYLYRDLIVPANVGSGLNEDVEQIVLWLDTSSSMTDFDLLVAKAILKSSEKIFPKKVSAFSFTTELQELEVSSMRRVDFTIKARGGTDIGVVLDKIAEKYKSSKILNIIISDGGFAWYLLSSRRNLYPKGKFMFIITDNDTYIENKIKEEQNKLGKKNMQYIIAEKPNSGSMVIRWR